MFTKPTDLEDSDLRYAVGRLWRIDVDKVVYAPVGFGSHHWIASGPSGRWFVTVDDLDACSAGAHDSRDAVFDRLERAFRSAHRLAHAGLRFVVAPIPTCEDEVLHRYDDRYSMLLHPLLDGSTPDDGSGEYRRAEDRHAVTRIVAELHAATAAVEDTAVRDDLVVPLRNELLAGHRGRGRGLDAGPYGERARALLDEHALDLELLLSRFDVLASRVVGEFDRYVITHGEPGAQNVLIVDGAHHLVDWESARIAAPERDLWGLDTGDGSTIAIYEQAAGRHVRAYALATYRMWYDLFEIAGYIEFFRHQHADTADAAESWKNLRYFLRPRERWAHLL